MARKSNGRNGKTIEQIKRSTMAGKDEIGCIVMWTCAEVRVHVDRLKQLYSEVGLDPDGDYFPPPLQGSALYRHCINRAKSGASKGSQRILARPILEDVDKIVTGYVREDADEQASDLDYEVEAKTCYVKAAETVRVKGQPGSRGLDVANEAKRLYDELSGCYVSKDIRRNLVRVIHGRMNSVCLRKMGGVYFTPPQHSDDVRRLGQITERLGESEFVVIPVHSTPEAKANVAKGARRALQEELTDLQQQLKEFREKTPREDTLQRRLEEFTELKARAEMYAELLEIKVDDIKLGLQAAAQATRKLLGEVQDEKAKPKSRGARKLKRQQPTLEV